MGGTIEISAKHSLQVVAAMIGFFAYVPLAFFIIKNRAVQSFAAFFLWALLDSIATATTFLHHGNYWLPFSNVIGSATITTILILKNHVSWSRVETMTSILVFVCLATWYMSGEKAGIIASSLAVVIATVPQMVETFKRPDNTPLNVYYIFLVANVISFIGGLSWTIGERFYAGCSVFLCLMIIVPAQVLFRKNKQPTA
ncbi:MAG: hypothetical protein WKF87_17585 [Chryseolinea sp.]